MMPVPLLFPDSLPDMLVERYNSHQLAAHAGKGVHSDRTFLRQWAWRNRVDALIAKVVA